jgi:hypothetical protein
LGPSKLLNIPEKLWIFLTGLFLSGFIQAPIFIITLPEALESFQIRYNIIEGFDKNFDNHLNDEISNLYNLFQQISSLISPIIGGVLYDHFKYRSTLDIIMLIELSFVLLFFLLNCNKCGYNLFSNAKKEN